MVPARIGSGSGLSAESARQRFGFEAAAAGPEAVLDAGDLDLVVVATPHDPHASLVARGAAPAISPSTSRSRWRSTGRASRACAPRSPATDGAAVRRLQPPLRARRRPSCAARRAAADGLPGQRRPLPPDHWTNDLEVGGGRLKGEGCHFVDFLCDQAGADPLTVTARRLPLEPDAAAPRPTTSASRSGSPTAASAPSTTRPTRPTGPGQGALRDELPGRLRRDRRLPRAAIWRGSSKTLDRRQPPGQGLRRPVRR